MSEEIVLTETPEEIAAPAVEQQPDGSESAPDENAPKPEAVPPVSRKDKRIERLTWEAAEARREAERLRGELERKAQEQPRTDKPVQDGKPKEDDFTTAAEFVEALADWKYEQRAASERAARQKEEDARNQTELQKKVQRELEAYRKSQPDFDEVMEDAAFNSSPLLIRELQESDMGPAVLYHFAKNPGEANRIAELTDPRKVAKEVAKIEARITSAPAATSQAPITSTLKPIRPVATSRQLVTKPESEMTDEEYFASMRAKGQ